MIARRSSNPPSEQAVKRWSGTCPAIRRNGVARRAGPKDLSAALVLQFGRNIVARNGEIFR